MKKLNKPIVWGMLGTISVWVPPIWHDPYFFFLLPIFIVLHSYSFFFITWAIAIVLAIIGIVYLVNAIIKKVSFNKIFLLFIIPNILYLTIGIRSVWMYYAIP